MHNFLYLDHIFYVVDHFATYKWLSLMIFNRELYVLYLNVRLKRTVSARNVSFYFAASTINSMRREMVVK
jgi:hypothetical protein